MHGEIGPGMMRLPNGERAFVDLRKIEDYCLSPTHPRGRHKARVLREALGIDRRDSEWLRQILLDAARSGEAVVLANDAFGIRWQIDIPVERHGKRTVVRSIWIVQTRDDRPRLVTCWVL